LKHELEENFRAITKLTAQKYEGTTIHTNIGLHTGILTGRYVYIHSHIHAKALLEYTCIYAVSYFMKENKLQMFETRVLKKIFGPKRDE
jgi:hypothetical protein